MGAFFGFLGALLGKLLGLWKVQPNRVEVVGREAATAETKLSTVEATNVEVAKANQARAHAADAVVLHPDSVYDDDGFKRP